MDQRGKQPNQLRNLVQAWVAGGRAGSSGDACTHERVDASTLEAALGDILVPTGGSGFMLAHMPRVPPARLRLDALRRQRRV